MLQLVKKISKNINRYLDVICYDSTNQCNYMIHTKDQSDIIMGSVMVNDFENCG